MSTLESYLIDKTPKTPHISFNPQSGDFWLKGKSVPENVVGFYAPHMAWLDKYVEQPNANTTLNIQLDYFNTSSAKALLDLMKRLENIQVTGKGNVTINWMYDENDEDMMEAGDDFRSVVKIPIHIIPFNKENEE